jgi:acetyl esterase/lipase
MKIILFVISFYILSMNVFSQNQVIDLWNGKVPGSIENRNYVENPNADPKAPGRVTKVSVPTISVFLPENVKNPVAAVVICPGGGYGRLATIHEGIDVAKWLNSKGVAAILLKYRLPSDSIMKDKKVGPLQDVQEAIRATRRNAAKWNIDPHKIGVMGFSAGGHLAATASTLFEKKVYQALDSTSARPDFSVLIYPVISMKMKITHAGSRKNLLGEKQDMAYVNDFSNEEQVSAKTPPAFLVHSADDNVVPVQNSLLYFSALQKFKIPAEIHVFQDGGHGYGMAPGQLTHSQWPEMLVNWMKINKFL